MHKLLSCFVLIDGYTSFNWEMKEQHRYHGDDVAQDVEIDTSWVLLAHVLYLMAELI